MGFSKLVAVVLLTLVYFQTAGRAELPAAFDHAAPKAGSDPRIEGGVPLTPAKLTDSLNTRAVDQLWWERARILINDIWLPVQLDKENKPEILAKAKDDIKALIGKVEDANKKLLLEALFTSRTYDPAKLNELMEKPGTVEGQAARQEMLFRMTNPAAIFIHENFFPLLDRAVGFAEEINLLVKQDKAGTNVAVQKKLAELIDRQMTNLNRTQRTELIKTIEALLKPETPGPKPTPEFLNKFLAAAKVSLNPTATDYKTDFEKEFQKIYNKTLEANKRFHELVTAANDPSDTKKAEAASKELLENYDKQDVLAFIGGQRRSGGDGIAVETLKAVADKRGGDYEMTFAPSSPLFKPGGSPVTINFGSKPEQINASLKALESVNANDFEPVNPYLVAPVSPRAFGLLTRAPKPEKPVEPKDVKVVETPGNPTIGLSTKFGKYDAKDRKAPEENVVAKFEPVAGFKVAEAPKPPTPERAIPADIPLTAKGLDTFAHSGSCKNCHEDKGTLGAADFKKASGPKITFKLDGDNFSKATVTIGAESGVPIDKFLERASGGKMKDNLNAQATKALAEWVAELKKEAEKK